MHDISSNAGGRLKMYTGGNFSSSSTSYLFAHSCSHSLIYSIDIYNIIIPVSVTVIDAE